MSVQTDEARRQEVIDELERRATPPATRREGHEVAAPHKARMGFVAHKAVGVTESIASHARHFATTREEREIVEEKAGEQRAQEARARVHHRVIESKAIHGGG